MKVGLTIIVGSAVTQTAPVTMSHVLKTMMMGLKVNTMVTTTPAIVMPIVRMTMKMIMMMIIKMTLPIC